MTIRDIMSVCIYVDDFQRAYDFYAHTLGLERSQEMGENGCFFRLNDNDVAIYLEGGHTQKTRGVDDASLSFMLTVNSAMQAYDELKDAGVTFVHDKPQDLGGGNFWFRFYDPAGNILEIVSSANQ